MFFSHRTFSCGIAIGYLTKSFEVEDIKSDTNGLLPLFDVKIIDQNLVFFNIYSANIENEQLSTLTELKNMLNNANNIYTIYILNK